MKKQSLWSGVWIRLRHVAIEVYCFLTAPFVVRSCLGIFSLLGVLLALTLWWMNCYTHHGAFMEVPDYVGKSIRTAGSMAKSNTFRVVVSDSIYMAGKMPGEILSQNPLPKSRVKQGRTLYFTIAKSNPELVNLPDLSGGDDFDLYSRKLGRLGVRPRISSRIADPRLENNTIVAVIHNGDTITRKIRSGYRVPVGSVVDFVVSEQVSDNVVVPDCLCETLGAARFLISAAQLRVGAIVKDDTVTDEDIAYVWRQSPPYDPNQIVSPGQTVDLYLTAEKPTFCPD